MILSGTHSLGLWLSSVHQARQILVDHLQRTLPAEAHKKLPNGQVLMVLEHLMFESRQPVRVQVTHRSISPWESCVEDPSIEKCHLMFYQCQPSERLVAMAREAYSRVNTIRIDAPTERSPKQTLQSELFTMPWAADIYTLEPVLTLYAERILVR